MHASNSSVSTRQSCRDGPLGFPRVVLAGHSLGAVKAVYYQGTHQDERVAALISASGPVQFGQWISEATERVRLAERMVAEGRGDELLPPDAGRRITSAQTFLSGARTNLDVYGLERADTPLAHIRCPVLFVLGSEEPHIGTPADFPLLRSNARAASAVETLYVKGADHQYRGRELAVGDWFERLV